MDAIALAVAYAVFLWWFSTGVIFFLNARDPGSFRWSMLGGTIVLVAALYGIQASADMATAGGAFIAFTCGVLVWGWHTMSYYMGVITGPRRESCPAGCRGWRHFVHAVETSLYHEAAIIATAALLVTLTWREPNPYGLWTFLVLWAMHVSAKLNVFLGVRNLNKDFIPQRLSYLTSYFRRRSMNLLFPVSVTAGTAVTVWLAGTALSPDAPAHVAIGHALIATLMALAVIEHWFMILPIPADALWRWSLDPAPVHRERSGNERARENDDTVAIRPTAPVSGTPPSERRQDPGPRAERRSANA